MLLIEGNNKRKLAEKIASTPTFEAHLDDLAGLNSGLNETGIELSTIPTDDARDVGANKNALTYHNNPVYPNDAGRLGLADTLILGTARIDLSLELLRSLASRRGGHSVADLAGRIDNTMNDLVSSLYGPNRADINDLVIRPFKQVIRLAGLSEELQKKSQEYQRNSRRELRVASRQLLKLNPRRAERSASRLATLQENLSLMVAENPMDEGELTVAAGMLTNFTDIPPEEVRGFIEVARESGKQLKKEVRTRDKRFKEASVLARVFDTALDGMVGMVTGRIESDLAVKYLGLSRATRLLAASAIILDINWQVAQIGVVSRRLITEARTGGLTQQMVDDEMAQANNSISSLEIINQ